ncbi:MAG: hypothetical protein IKV50_06730, partial [Clostridia bacterium]|nr:hypothetical protein [Clostridia bacterium]
MKHLRHLLVLLMVLALALPMLVACNNQPANNTDTSSAGTQNDTSVPGDESEVNNDVPPEIVELNREIRILCWDWSAGSASIKGYTGEVISNAEGEASRVDVAKKAVRDAVEDEYKVTITGQVTNKQSFLDDVKQMVTTGTYECDIVFASGHYAQNFARSSALTDLNTIETLNFENSWWDQNCVNDVSVGGRLF